MTININRMRAVAERLCGANGRPVTLLAGGTTYVDSDRPWLGRAGLATGAAPAREVEVTAVQVEYDEEGVPVAAGKRVYVFAASAALEAGVEVDVEEFSHVRDGNRVWRITRVSYPKPGALGVTWRLECEQGVST